MPKYYANINNRTKLNARSGTEVVLPLRFAEFSSLIISRCSFLQGLVQNVIYATHGQEIFDAKRKLKEFPSPRARIEFLSTFQYSESDPVVSSVFEFARSLFLELYELRNVLAHEDWRSSDDFGNMVLFASLDEEARLLLASGRLLNDPDTTPKEIYEATVRFIESVKVVSITNLKLAIADANLCSWILMQISQILNEPNLKKKEEIRKAFLLFRGTSHLFENVSSLPETVEVNSSRSKTVGD